jgi:hypothetical protein
VSREETSKTQATETKWLAAQDRGKAPWLSTMFQKEKDLCVENKNPQEV